MSLYFCSEVWEKKPILLSRKSAMYNEGWFSCQELDKILSEVCIMNC